MNNTKINQLKIKLLLTLFIAIFYAFLSAIGVGCPIQYVSGISCASCGMTRAWLALLHLDIMEVINFHPLFWIGPLIVIFFLLDEFIPKSIKKPFWSITIALLIVVYILRLFVFGSDVIYFDPQNGLIGKIITRIL